MMLKGDNLKGTLRFLQENGMVHVSVSVPGLQENNQHYSVYIFFNEEKYEKIGQLESGETQAKLPNKGEIKAAGVIQDTEGGIFIMTGETEDFNWDHAKSVFYLKSRTQVKEAANGENEENKANDDIFKDTYPLTDDIVYPEEIVKIEDNLDASDLNVPIVQEAPQENDIPDNTYQPYEEAVNTEKETENSREEIAEAEEDSIVQRVRSEYENMQSEVCAECPIHAKKTIVYPFSKQYREFEWEKTEYPGLKGYWHYITGRLYVNGVLRKIAIGVPGDYALNPPSWLYGFDTYAFADDGEARGYWILFEDA